jgi:hypothetical protein
MEYLASLNLNILNPGNEPTFEVCKRRDLTDLTLGTNKISNLVNNWHVSVELLMSDHRYIFFRVGKMGRNQTTFRDPNRTNWEPQKELRVNLETLSLTWA